MNVSRGLIGFILGKETNIQIQSDPWIKLLQQKMKVKLPEQELVFRLREILYLILIWRKAYLSQGLGKEVNRAYEELEKAEQELVWEGSETVFVPLYQEVAKRYDNIRLVDQDIVRIKELLGNHCSSSTGGERQRCRRCPEMAV